MTCRGSTPIIYPFSEKPKEILICCAYQLKRGSDLDCLVQCTEEGAMHRPGPETLAPAALIEEDEQLQVKLESSQVSPISWLPLAAADVLSCAESRLKPEPTPVRAAATPFDSDPRQRRRSIAQTQSPRFPSR
jgi:hypothetical protein